MTEWKNIHPNFNEDLAQKWQNEGLDFEQTKKWIETGFNPNDYEFISFVRGNLGYNVEENEEPISKEDIENLRLIYQNDLANQSFLLNEYSHEQEANNQGESSQTNSNNLQENSLISQEKEEEKEWENADLGLLTDDNIEYILQNDETINNNKGENIQIKSDLANIYLQIEKSKRGEKVDEDFWNSLDTGKRYVILPLRVRTNHWSLLLFVNNRRAKTVLWVRYISSHPSCGEVFEELKELERFLAQAVKKYNNSIFRNADTKEIILWGVPKQENTWDCGVYLIEFIKFLCRNEYHDLNEWSLIINHQRTKEFRERWKEEIGEEKWCKWDVANINSLEENQLCLGEKKEEKASESDVGNLFSAKEKEITELKTTIQNLQKLLFSNLSRSRELEKTQQMNEELKTELKLAKEEVFQVKKANLGGEIKSKREELNEIIEEIKKEKRDAELIEDLLETQKEFTKSGNPFAQKQLSKYKERLMRDSKENEEKIEKVCQIKDELTRLEMMKENHLEAKIEINSK